ncbi:CDP-glucose 4,6-dehydratase [Pseudomonas sp.]|uniref:CDP-glucose 4,6-dehydratase n=1 Tax=Pseudomonas sp. TaxID=306 RepID=UPI00299E9732|nr:CDP-glucose 4,6-dehydratase [Pseudomonas sp.]MDX1367072.1 CDP-glucose 4,6-dehydratase [Pseudomonas sp.]
MAGVELSPAFWRGKRVLLTGHTGFKGSWLALKLSRWGAQVTGYALLPDVTPCLSQIVGIDQVIDGRHGDLRDLSALQTVVNEVKPEIVLHLAAQALVRRGYDDPLGTYSSNVMGTLNLLEALRRVGSVRACVVVTTDKVYANQEWAWPYRENEALGGHDPYSSSKACCELLVQSFAASYFPTARHDQHGLAVATARAGNVLGGGDFAADRLVPDILGSWDAGKPVVLRYPEAVRPWQHVLEPLTGYLQLAQGLYQRGPLYQGAWNFGPADADCCSVAELVAAMASIWPDAPGFSLQPAQLHEAGLLRLDSSKARQRLGWRPSWNLRQCLEQTLAWHLAWRQGADMQAFSLQQITDHWEAA